MNHAIPAANPLHTALVCVLLFGGSLVVQIVMSRAPQPDPWAGLASSSGRARAVVDALGPCEQALEDANGAAGSDAVKRAPAICAAALSAVNAATLPEPCRAAAASATDAAGALARGEEAGRDIARYRAARTKCLAEAAA